MSSDDALDAGIPDDAGASTRIASDPTAGLDSEGEGPSTGEVAAHVVAEIADVGYGIYKVARAAAPLAAVIPEALAVGVVAVALSPTLETFPPPPCPATSCPTCGEGAQMSGGDFPCTLHSGHQDEHVCANAHNWY